MSLKALVDQDESPMQATRAPSPPLDQDTRSDPSTVPRTLPPLKPSSPPPRPATSSPQPSTSWQPREPTPAPMEEDQQESDANATKQASRALLRASEPPQTVQTVREGSAEAARSSPPPPAQRPQLPPPPALRLPSLSKRLSLSKAPVTHSLKHYQSSPPSIYKESWDDSSRYKASSSAPKPGGLLFHRLASASQREGASRSYPPTGASSSEIPTTAHHQRSLSTPALTSQGSSSVRPQPERQAPPPFRQQPPLVRGSQNAHKRPPSPTNAQQQHARRQKQIQEEVQQSFEAIASELGKIDELSLSLEPARGAAVTLRRPGALATNVSKDELVHRRSMALSMLNELHSRCSAMNFTVWCPSEKCINSYHSHIEEDLSLLQREIAALEERQRPFDQLLLLRRKLLSQRYYWRTRLNSIER